MKYIKKFEKNDSRLKIGDYVICEVGLGNIRHDFITERIGRYVYNLGELGDVYNYMVEYDWSDLPGVLDVYVWEEYNAMCFLRSEIKYWNKDRNELEMMFNVKKFNI